MAAATSSYIQISDYALIEYIYSNDIIVSSKAKPLRLYNNYSREYQYINNAQATNLTGNILDYSAVCMGRESTKWAYLDMDTVAPIIQIDPNLKLVDVTANVISNIKYDKVRLHLVAGFDFPGLDGIILQIGWKQWDISGSGGTNFTAANQVYIKGEERLELASIPLFVGDRLYNRYLEFSVPSLADINFDFWNSPTAPNTLGYQYTFDNVGFQQDAQISATLYEIDTTTTEGNGNKYFITGEKYVASFNSSDLYSYVTAVVKESETADYIEYYPTWKGQFLEDYINLLNAAGGEWVVINQLQVYEQLGSNFIKTFDMTSLQDTTFDAPAAYRPVIRNASLAISYTVEYTMRLLNKSNGQEIIRKANFTSTNPKKYGPSIQKINVLEGFTPVKVYNKIVKMTEDNLTQSVQYLGSPNIMTQNVYVNSYYDVNYISVDSTTDISNVLGQVVYPQGLNYIFINKFDNYVKFKIFTKSADKKQNVSLDLSSTGMNIKLAFIFDDQSKTYLDPVQDPLAADPGAGEVLFRVEDTLSTKLLGGKGREYFIINKNDLGDEVLIYSGKFASQSERASVTAANNSTALNQLNTQINALNTASNNLTTPLTGLGAVANSATGGGPNASVSNGPLVDDEAAMIAAAQSAQSTLSTNIGGLQQALQNAATNNTTAGLNIPDLPGFTPFGGANVNNALTPNVVSPSNPSTQLSAQSVSSSALSKNKGGN
jgi:hypothetical protein